MADKRMNFFDLLEVTPERLVIREDGRCINIWDKHLNIRIIEVMAHKMTPMYNINNYSDELITLVFKAMKLLKQVNESK